MWSLAARYLRPFIPLTIQIKSDAILLLLLHILRHIQHRSWSKWFKVPALLSSCYNGYPTEMQLYLRPRDAQKMYKQTFQCAAVCLELVMKRFNFNADASL